jgi:hypothetical protein
LQRLAARRVGTVRASSPRRINEIRDPAMIGGWK